MNHVVSIALQLIIMTLFNNYILDLRWSRKQYLSLFIISIIPTLLLYLYVGAVSVFYFITVFSVFIYRKKENGIVFFHIFMSLILLVISDNISSLLVMRYFNQEMNGTVTPIMYLILLVVFGTIFAFIYKNIFLKVLKRFIVHDALSYVLALLTIGTSTIIYMNIMAIDQNNYYENVKSNFWLFLVFFILLIVSFFIVLFLAFQRYKIKRREEEMKNFEAYISSIEQINRDMRKFKHDYVNMLTSLKTFIDDENYHGLQTYFYGHVLEMNHQEQLNEQALMMLNNLKVDSLKGLFTTKIIQAQAKKIPFYVEVVEEITDIPTDPIALNRMVGILLDNAIEAAKDADDKEVRVAIIQMNDGVLIVINNTYDTSQNLKVHELFEEGFSTKGKNRGLGLSTFREVKEQLPNINTRTKIHPPLFTQELEFRKEKP